MWRSWPQGLYVEQLFNYFLECFYPRRRSPTYQDNNEEQQKLLGAIRMGVVGLSQWIGTVTSVSFFA